MDKKILVGSIIAVAVLIGVSFTSVVGFHSVKSTSAIHSPLFGIRIRRAIGQRQQDISTDYLGYGESINIYLTGRIRRAEQVQKAIDILRDMDDRAFSKMVAKITFQLKNQKQMTAKETSEMLKIFHHIRRNPNYIKDSRIYFKDINNQQQWTATCYEFETKCNWVNGCIIRKIIEAIWWLLDSIILCILGWQHCSDITCKIPCTAMI